MKRWIPWVWMLLAVWAFGHTPVGRVFSQAAISSPLHADDSFAKAGFSLTDGKNAIAATPTATATDALGRNATNSVAVNVAARVRRDFDDVQEQGLVAQDRDDSIDYDGCAGQGSVRYLTGTSGTVTVKDTYTNDAFAIQIASAGQTVNRYRYTGEQWDEDLGMYYLRARYYHPDLGRFWTMDSYEGSLSDPLSLHKYLYCHGEPVNNADPSGQFIGGLTELTTSMSIRIANFAQRSQKFRKAVDKSYYPVVTTYVLANLVLGLADPEISMAAILATPYQYLLIRDFNKKGNKLKTKTITRIRRLASSFGRAAGGSLSAAAAGVQIKPNGFPDFTSSQHPVRGLVFLPKGLSGGRYQDENLANQLTGRAAQGTPNGYVWHHHEIPGIMQLVRRSKHNTGEKGAAHDGGALFWSILKDEDYK